MVGLSPGIGTAILVYSRDTSIYNRSTTVYNRDTSPFITAVPHL